MITYHAETVKKDGHVYLTVVPKCPLKKPHCVKAVRNKPMERCEYLYCEGIKNVVCMKEEE